MMRINPLEGFDFFSAVTTTPRTTNSVAERPMPRLTRVIAESSPDGAGLLDGWFACEGSVLWGKEVGG
jgi:hypothetical protein